MTISMFDLMCITNRKLCKTSFLSQIEEIAQNNPAGIILREKDLPEAEYMALARQVMEICRHYHVPCILHNFLDAATALHADAIHLPLPVLRSIAASENTGFQKKDTFLKMGASCHSLEEALEAERLGCTYITAGHIFQTDCKKGVPPRGIGFLRNICQNVSIPVYAIGGIDGTNIASVENTGAKGACIMSGFMSCEDVKDYKERCLLSLKIKN